MKKKIIIEIDKAIKTYIDSRKDLIQVGEKYPEYIGGNDNMIGRIGEYYALKILIGEGQNPQKIKESNNKGYDFIDQKTNKNTQVKVITGENKNGKTVRLKKPWDQFILIQLNELYQPVRIGIINEKQFKKAQKELKTTQLRKFFSQAKLIEANLKEKGWDAVSADFAMLIAVLILRDR